MLVKLQLVPPMQKKVHSYHMWYNIELEIVGFFIIIMIIIIFGQEKMQLLWYLIVY